MNNNIKLFSYINKSVLLIIKAIVVCGLNVKDPLYLVPSGGQVVQQNATGAVIYKLASARIVALKELHSGKGSVIAKTLQMKIAAPTHRQTNPLRSWHRIVFR